MAAEELVHVLTLCGNCSCGCPELYIDPSAPIEQRIVISDDFGSTIRLSPAQLGDIVELARAGSLDEATKA
ncbi:hypothetical protein [Micromonospora sp. NBC_01813]|uniref:hypothetical protein n=1 Tax=Micromonospora sp. NBC_01813 TaxID=2975988 RepID=UPI002DD8C05C|nr:hypothetical protein [Micromonospora sp. NBC_01813]WSA10795.1 hypothetical protein OG958_08450 [Micromonospora sp. NBC_01813]